MSEDKKSMKDKIEEVSKKVSKNTTKKKTTDKQKIEELKTHIRELQNDFLRSRADYDNFKKRVEKEKAEIRDKTIINFVLDILPAIDNFEMSLKMTENKEMFVKGVEMIHKNLIDTLKEHKIEGFDALEGDLFDSNLHDPILIEDNTKEANKVICSIKKGFKHKENVIRPARVQVPKND